MRQRLLVLWLILAGLSSTTTAERNVRQRRDQLNGPELPVDSRTEEQHAFIQRQLRNDTQKGTNSTKKVVDNSKPSKAKQTSKPTSNSTTNGHQKPPVNTTAQTIEHIPEMIPVKPDTEQIKQERTKEDIVKQNQHDNTTSTPPLSDTNATSLHPTDDDLLTQQIHEKELEVKEVGGFGTLLGVAAMIFTAWQISDHPDGIYAAMCRLILTILGLALQVVCAPFRMCCGCGSALRGVRQHHSYGQVGASMDYGYRDPSLEMA
jgi:hypothetical protein